MTPKEREKVWNGLGRGVRQRARVNRTTERGKAREKETARVKQAAGECHTLPNEGAARTGRDPKVQAGR